jgi:hypothetical protein
MTKIIDTSSPTPSIADSLRTIGDSTFGYGALGAWKNNKAAGKKAQADAAAKAQDALRRGDVLEFLAQSEAAGTSGDDALNYVRAGGLLPARPSMLDPVPRMRAVLPSNAAPPYRTIRSPARSQSVWDTAPGTFALTPSVPKKAPQNPFDGSLAPFGYDYGQL